MSDQTADVSGEVELTVRARERLESLRYLGEFTEADAEARRCRLLETVHGQDNAHDHIRMWWLIDDAGYIRDVRYRTLATGLELLAFDLMAELCVGVTADQAARITPAHIIERLRLVYDQEQVQFSWPAEQPFAVLQKAAGRAPLDDDADDAQEKPGADWGRVGLFEKVRRIEGVLDEYVRPMLASDGGGMDLVDLRDDNTLVVAYHGACGGCSASIGGTMFFIEDTLEQHLGVPVKLDVQGMESEPVIDL